MSTHGSHLPGPDLPFLERHRRVCVALALLVLVALGGLLGGLTGTVLTHVVDAVLGHVGADS